MKVKMLTTVNHDNKHYHKDAQGNVDDKVGALFVKNKWAEKLPDAAKGEQVKNLGVNTKSNGSPGTILANVAAEEKAQQEADAKAEADASAKAKAEHEASLAPKA